MFWWSSWSTIPVANPPLCSAFVTRSVSWCVLGGARAQLSPWPTLRCAPPLSPAVFCSVCLGSGGNVSCSREQGGTKDMTLAHSHFVPPPQQYKAVCPLAEEAVFSFLVFYFFDIEINVFRGGRTSYIQVTKEVTSCKLHFFEGGCNLWGPLKKVRFLYFFKK